MHSLTLCFQLVPAPKDEAHSCRWFDGTNGLQQPLKLSAHPPHEEKLFLNLSCSLRLIFLTIDFFFAFLLSIFWSFLCLAR
jgi:hypothetical protein